MRLAFGRSAAPQGTPMRTAEDRLIDRLEAAETRKYAKRQRHELGWAGLKRVDPLSLESISGIWTVRGRAAFQLGFANDDEVRSRQGWTTYDGSAFVVRIPERTRREACLLREKPRAI
jgi:hypothetical protein